MLLKITGAVLVIIAGILYYGMYVNMSYFESRPFIATGLVMVFAAFGLGGAILMFGDFSPVEKDESVEQ